MHLIAGIDPGATAGIALIGLDGARIVTHSLRHGSVSDIIGFIERHGIPVVVATDKARVPETVRKIAAAFNASLFVPSADVRMHEKKELVAGFDVRNDHEADALAAALLAKQAHGTILEKIERDVRQEQRASVAALLLRGDAGNIESALALLAPRANFLEKSSIKKRQPTGRVHVLAYELAAARERNRVLERMRAREPRVVVTKTDSPSMAQLRDAMANALRRKDAVIDDLRGIIEGRLVRVVVYRDEMDDAAVAGCAVVLDMPTPGRIERIERTGATAIIAEKDITSALPVMDKRNVNIRTVDTFLVVDADVFTKARHEHDFTAWLAAYKARHEKHAGHAGQAR